VIAPNFCRENKEITGGKTMEDQNNKDPSYAELMREDVKEAGRAFTKKTAEVLERPGPWTTPLAATPRLVEIGLSMAKPLAKAAGHGIQALADGMPSKMSMSSYKDENGNIKWGYFPASAIQNAKSDPGKTEAQPPAPEKTFDFKKDKTERQQALQHRGQTSTPAAKTTSKSQSRGNVNSR
jgi:hypothetical protein